MNEPGWGSEDKKYGRLKPLAAGLPGRRLGGGWLVLARSVWLLLTLGTLFLFALSVVPGFNLLRTVCASKPCGPEQLSPEGTRTIGQLGLSLEWYAAYQTVLVVVFALVFSAAAMVIFWRRSDDLMALYTSVTLVLTGVFLPDWMGLLAPIYPVLWLPLNLLDSLMYCFLFILCYLFPDGGFVPRWTRWAAVAWIALQGARYVPYDSPLIPANWPPVSVAVLVVILVFTCLFAQVYRYRRVSSLTQRQQTKWVVFGLTTMLAVIVLATVPPAFFPALDDPGSAYDLAVDFVSFSAILLVPVAFGIAILRYRLFDVDVLINRTLVYAGLTVTLTGVYIGSVVLLQGILLVLTGGTSQLAIVASTLTIAALFSPLRSRFQEFIDRRFYRRKYDVARTLQTFNGRLRNDTDLDELGGELVGVVRDTMQPRYVSVWLRDDPGLSKRHAGVFQRRNESGERQ